MTSSATSTITLGITATSTRTTTSGRTRHSGSYPPAASAVALLLAWTTFTVGGVYPWAWIPAILGAFLIALVLRPPVAQDPRSRWLDVALLTSGGAIMLQMLPLPVEVLRRIDPHALVVRLALWVGPPQIPQSWIPITIAPGDTRASLAIVAGTMALFWACRRICEQKGIGRMVRAVAVIGLIASLAAIMQRSENKELIYGYFRPRDAGARPFGPFVNRNHFATWVIMACPLVFGYLIARAPAGRGRDKFSQRVVSALKQLGSIRIWLAAGICLMTLAVLLSTSRSGIIGLIAGLMASVWLTRSGEAEQTRRWTIFQGALLVLVILSFANFDAVLARFDETIARRDVGRPAIWSVTRAMIRDFPITGTGAGTYARAILPYGPPNPGYSTSNAHNHYLQIAAEGGALLVIPAALVLGCFVFRAIRCLGEDTSSDRMIRAGAMAGLLAVMVQSFWETGLLMPANAMLFAVLAAIAVHAPSGTAAHRRRRDD